MVILVDDEDNEIGLMEKMEAHIKAAKHRAFSIFVFNSNNELLIHRRALSKYHSPGLWTNTCCSHPRKGETLQQAVHRRLKEEMGFDCELSDQFQFSYKADVGDGLTENEFDHVFVGKFNGKPLINKDEVDDWKYMSMENIQNDLNRKPDNYTVWFKIAFKHVRAFLNAQSDN